MKRTIQGVDTHYQIIGSHQKKLILLHGWGCNWQIWSPVISELSKSAQLIIPDLPAFGQSANPKVVWDSTDYAHWLKTFAQETVGATSFALLGHSFGGKIGALLAAEPGELRTQFEKFIIVDASGLPLALTPKEQLVQTFSGILPEFLKKRIGALTKERLLQQLGVAADYQHANSYQQQVLKKIVRENIAPELKKITIPTLIVWGAHDETTPVAKGKEFAAQIPKSQLVIMNASGHYPFVDETAAFINTVTNFI